ncbi:unnamed protein product [Closterium sp. NIES-53]
MHIPPHELALEPTTGSINFALFSLPFFPCCFFPCCFFPPAAFPFPFPFPPLAPFPPVCTPASTPSSCSILANTSAGSAVCCPAFSPPPNACQPETTR